MKYTTAFVVSLTLLVSTIAALAQEKGAEYTLVVPLGLMEYEGVGGFASTNRIYGVEVHGESDWGINFAHVETTSFEKISRTDNGLVEYEFRVDGRWMKLRVQDAAVFEQFAAPGSEEGDAAQRLVDAAVERLSETAFGGTDIPRESWRDLVLYARVLGAQTLPPPATFRGNAYFTVDLGQDGTSYNSARLNETQRVSRVITDLLDRVKTAGELADVGFAGLRLDTTISFRNFVSDGDSGIDELTWYIDSALVPALRDFEITGQGFVDESVVIVNGTRMQVSLADQG